MVLAFRLSERLGHASAADTERLVAHLRRVGLPTTIQEVAQPAPDPDRLLGFMRQDKKVHGGNLGFVLVRGLGHAFISSEVPLGSVKAVLAD
jgi:3-dehydroquinate synthase